MSPKEPRLAEAAHFTRRTFLGGATGGLGVLAGVQAGPHQQALAPELTKILANLEPYLTPQEKFQDVSRGQPVPHSLSEARKREAGLTRETWKLEIVSDKAHPASLAREFKKSNSTAIDFKILMDVAAKRAVRFPKVMTCLNIGCTLGMGIWEGVPLRELIWLTNPRENLRRVYYFGYHNNDPKQLFQSSLPIGRVLEDTHDLPPVILCYKLNGHWLDAKRGGPVRVVVPEAYGFKSVKWIQQIVLTNLYHANDTYAQGNNDVDSSLKTFAGTLLVPPKAKAGERLPLAGYAQVGISGLSKVQVWIQAANAEWPADDPHFTQAPWVDAQILPPPANWGGDLPHNRVPEGTLGFEAATGKPQHWPLRLTKIHWAAVLPGLPAGEYVVRCRTIDEKGIAQPMPRPFRKSGHSAIESMPITVGA